MKIQTPNGTAEGQPLSDIQRYNRTLQLLTINVWSWFLLVVWLVWYVARHDILTRVARMCLG